MNLRIYNDIKVFMDDKNKGIKNVIYRLKFSDDSTYIGCTETELKKRIVMHCHTAMNPNQKDFNNKKNFKIRNEMQFMVEVLYMCKDDDDIFEKEIEFIALERSLNNKCLNESIGGKGSSRTWTEESKEKLSKSKHKPVQVFNKSGELISEFESQSECADYYGVSIASISAYTLGKRNPSNGLIYKLKIIN